MPSLGFDYPWLLIAALPLAFVCAWLLLRTDSPLGRLRASVGATGLTIACLCLLLVAAQMVLGLSSRRRTVFVAVDRSLSAGNAATQKLPSVLAALSHQLNDDDFVGVISFGETARVEMDPKPAHRFDNNLELSRFEPSDETWSRSAFELAAAHGAPGTSVEIVMISDGYDSSQRYGMDIQREARIAGVRVSALSIDSEPLPEIAVAEFSARLAGREKQALDVSFILYSTAPQHAEYDLRINGEPVLTQQRDVGVGRNPVSVRIPLQTRLASYVVEVSVNAPQDTTSRNNHLKLAVAGQGEARVLLLYGPHGPDESLAKVLRDGGINVVMGEASSLPSDQVELSRYQAIILSDVPATALPADSMARLEQFTRQGGGLAMLGGPGSFAPGGYYETPIERALPITCDVTEHGRKQIPALLLVLDRSGSMMAPAGSHTKMELANEGCVLALELANIGSIFGILAVDTVPNWVVNLGKLSDKGAATAQARSNRVGGGGIYCNVAMREAIDTMRKVKASSRHIVLFADGSDADQQDGVVEMVKRAHTEDEITVSVICMGKGQDVEFLRSVAKAGEGRFEFVDDATQLPAVFSREAAQAGGTFVRESNFVPVVGGASALTEGFTFGDPQSLRGYVATTARPDANVPLWADDEKERPLLAYWYYGLGRGLVFTSDARDRWASNWLPWDGYAKLWQRWVRWLLPPANVVSGVEAEWSLGREGPQVLLSFFNAAGEPRQLNSPRADLIEPDGGGSQASMLAVGPGQYRVQFSRGGSGVYAATVSEQLSNGEQRLAAREHLVYVPLDELRQRPADTTSLAALCKASGGRLLEQPSEFAALPGLAVTRNQPASNWLLVGALMGFITAIGARRFPVLRKGVEQARRVVKEEASAAHEAFSRVREKLERKPQTTGEAAMLPAYDVAPPPVASVAPAVAAAPEQADDQGGLLGAMRKARKDLENRQKGGGNT